VVLRLELVEFSECLRKSKWLRTVVGLVQGVQNNETSIILRNRIIQNVQELRKRWNCAVFSVFLIHFMQFVGDGFARVYDLFQKTSDEWRSTDCELGLSKLQNAIEMIDLSFGCNLQSRSTGDKDSLPVQD
jgi:hypothetical protein